MNTLLRSAGVILPTAIGFLSQIRSVAIILDADPLLSVVAVGVVGGLLLRTWWAGLLVPACTAVGVAAAVILGARTVEFFSSGELTVQFAILVAFWVLGGVGLSAAAGSLLGRIIERKLCNV